MSQPDREGAFTGKPPQDLRRDLFEIRKGMVRIDVESPFHAIGRFHEAQEALQSSTELPGAITIPHADLGSVEPNIIFIPNQTAMLQREVNGGPRLQRRLILLDTFSFPWFSTRRSERQRRERLEKRRFESQLRKDPRFA